ncbi:MAG: SDH family Clp fold serine proteinase [Candidatus Woesearchaeota archaeon]
MTEAKRLELIKKIEKIRNSKVITYVISDRRGINTSIETDDLRELTRHIARKEKIERLDMFIYSLGGDASIAWALPNLIREYATNFEVLIPMKAFSCATSISLGADKIIMHKSGILGPVDPLVANPFNPEIRNQITPISVEDVAGYLKLLKEKFDITDQANITTGFEKLAGAVHPLALGNVFRNYLKSRDDTKKLLELHLDSKTQKERIEKIIDILVEKLYYHGHHINRKEARDTIGLDVGFAEDYSVPNLNLSDVMWELFEEYEKDLKIDSPYKDELPLKGDTNELIVKFIESSDLSSMHVIEQTFHDLGFPEECKLVNANNQPAVYIPSKNSGEQPQVLPIAFQGTPIFINNKIIDKKEIFYWKRKKTSQTLNI